MTKTSTQFKVLVWGQKGQRAGTRILGRKEYKQEGSARRFAQTKSSERNVHYTEIFSGKEKQPMERFRKGEIDQLKIDRDGHDIPKMELARANTMAGTAGQTSDLGTGRYALMIERHLTGKLKSVQHYSKFGLSKAQAKEIRARVKSRVATDGIKATKVKTPKRAVSVRSKIAEAKDAYERATIAATQKAVDLDDRVAVEKATLTSAMSALIRERQNAVNLAQRELEDTLKVCDDLGIHASIA